MFIGIVPLLLQKHVAYDIIIRAIEHQKEAYLPPTARHDYFTPYDRFKAVWFESRPTAFQESRDFGFGFSSDGQMVVVHDGDGQSHELFITAMRQGAQKVILKLQDVIECSLPEEARCLFHDFSGTFFSDDLNDEHSIFKQKKNAIILAPIIQEIKDAIFTSLQSGSGTNRINESAAYRQ